MKIGIDKIGFFTPSTYLEMNELASVRGIDPNKYLLGLGQEQMAVPAIYEDAVTLAANAAESILTETERQAIDLVLVGSESGVDNSKSIATYIHSMLKLPKKCRAIELKQACYGATMAIQMAKGHLLQNPDRKVLVIATDIAKYGLNTPGEPTQGAGAVAMIISANPKIASIENDTSYLTEDIMDFWRPIYSDYAFADGKFSTEKYMEFFNTVWQDYCEQTGRTFKDFKAICFHQPFTKIGFKALDSAFKQQNVSLEIENRILESYTWSKVYNTRVGNIYTGSLYLSLVSLLENSANLQSGDRIGLFSYGSGAVGEFFSIVLEQNFEAHLHKEQHMQLFENRKKLSIEQYETVMTTQLPKDGTMMTFEAKLKNQFALEKIENHIRYYTK